MYTKVISIPKADVSFCWEIIDTVTTAFNSLQDGVDIALAVHNQSQVRLLNQLFAVVNALKHNCETDKLKEITPTHFFVMSCLLNYPRLNSVFLEGGLDPNTCINFSGESFTPLLAAIRAKKNRSFERLLKHHTIDLEQTDLEGGTALGFTITLRNNKMLDALLAHGVNPNHVHKKQITPLILAIVLGQQDFVKKLLQKGADPNQATPEGVTPYIAAYDEGYKDIVALLVKFGATIPVDYLGITASYAQYLMEVTAIIKNELWRLTSGFPIRGK